MKRHFLTFVALSALTVPVAAQTPTAPSHPAPSEIVAAAPASDWVAIDPADLLLMQIGPDAEGQSKFITIQLMPPPFSQGWIANIRTLAAARWWDGLSINRVQDNYVVQWGDADGEDAAKARALPEGLRVMPESDYVNRIYCGHHVCPGTPPPTAGQADSAGPDRMYGGTAEFNRGWPIAANGMTMWPVHCYGMVGVGRNLSPDTGNGAELYTVIGHAPRHLDRNIALVGRVIEGIEHLSSLPRGTGPLGFYERPEQRTHIRAIMLATRLPEAARPRFEYLSTESESFARYSEARANRRDPFFNVPAGGADICNIPVPVRRVTSG